MSLSRLMPGILQVMAAFCAAVVIAGPVAAQAVSPKLAADLVPTLAPGAPPQVSWARSSNGQTYVKLLVEASSNDPSLASLRQFMLAQGGSVHHVYVSVRALSGLMPASALPALAARSDVIAITPNRLASRSGSLVQDASGVSAVPRLGGVTAVDGRGIGIAVLDSGIDWDHRSMKDSAGKTRVAAAVDFVALSRRFASAGWQPGVDYSAATAKLMRFDTGVPVTAELALLAPRSTQPDPYGHGTFVASIAAGSGAYQSPDSSGVASGATLYDVRVLDEKGVGNMADVLAGIDWVVQRSRLLNIRVMNLSLAADSTDSFLLDPLARAARSAVASGIVVVAAAGNGGKNAAGAEVYGSIGSPGNEPSVITVGASNLKFTAARGDDVVTTFSARGPTRGRLKTAGASPWVDNLLKPDLVAPGNRLLGAVAVEDVIDFLLPRGWRAQPEDDADQNGIEP